MYDSLRNLGSKLNRLNHGSHDGRANKVKLMEVMFFSIWTQKDRRYAKVGFRSLDQG